MNSSKLNINLYLRQKEQEEPKHRGDSQRSRYALVCYFTPPRRRNQGGFKPNYGSYSKTFYSRSINPNWREPYPKTSKQRFEKMIYGFYADGNLLHALVYLNINKANSVNNHLALFTPYLKRYQDQGRNVYKSVDPLYAPVQNLLVWKFDPGNGGMRDMLQGWDEQITLHAEELPNLKACDTYYNYLVSDVKMRDSEARSLVSYLGRNIGKLEYIYKD